MEFPFVAVKFVKVVTPVTKQNTEYHLLCQKGGNWSVSCVLAYCCRCWLVMWRDCFISHFNLKISGCFWIPTAWLYFYFLLQQECDQVHIEDVASDDNGQDLRWCSDECVKCIAGFCWGFQPQWGWSSALCRGWNLENVVVFFFLSWVVFLWRPTKH